MSPLILTAAFIVALVVFFVGFSFWRQMTIFVMFWIVIVGAIRKWFLPQLADLIFFSAHAFLLGPYVRVFLFNQKRFQIQNIKNLKIFLMILLTWCFASILNPHSPSLIVGVVGFIVYFYFMPIAFIVPRIFQTKKKLFDFFMKYCLFALPIFLLGVMQYFSPRNSVINKYVDDAAVKNIALVGEYVRVTSTFSYISGYGTYLNFMLLIMIGLLSLKVIKARGKIILAGLASLCLLNLFMTGSRGYLGMTLILSFLFLLFSLKTNLKKFLKFVVFLTAFLSIAIPIFLHTESGKASYAAFMKRTTENKDVGKRLNDTFDPFKFADKAGLLGYGIGSTYPALARFNFDWRDMPLDFEEEPERIVLELGTIGFFLIYGFRLILFLHSLRLVRVLKDPDLKFFAIICALFQAQFLFVRILVFNHTSNILYWFTVGIAFTLPYLDALETAKKLERNQDRASPA